MNSDNIFSSYEEWLDNADLPRGQRAVLKASVALFSEQGFDGTSTAQIAEKAGVSQGTIFKYYKTKQDLLKAIVTPTLEHLLPVFRDSFINSLPDDGDLQSLIHFALQDRYEFLTANAEAIQILLSELLVNQAVRDEFKRLLVKSLPVFQNGPLAGLQKSGQIRSDLTPLEIARTIVGQLLLYFLQFKFSSTPMNSKADLAKIESLIVAALRPQPKVGNEHVTNE